jgi:predicted ATPase
MKTTLKIENFKSLQEVELCLKRNTFLLGANGSGKSSLLKLLLFIKKNIFEIDEERMHRRYNEPVIYYEVSNIIDLSSFKDIVFNNEVEREIKVKFQCEFNSDELRDIHGAWFRTLLFPSDILSDASKLQDFYNKGNFKEALNIVKDNQLFYDLEYSDLIKNFRLSFEIIFRKNTVTRDDELEYKIVDVDTGSFFKIKLDSESGATYVDKTSGHNSYTSPWSQFLFFNTKEFVRENNDHKIFSELDYESILDEKFLERFKKFQERYLESVLKLRIEDDRYKKMNDNEFSKIVLLGILQLFKFFFAFPCILRHFFISNHFPTIRELPKHNYMLTNSKFPLSDYYGILNFFDEKILSNVLGEIVKLDKDGRFSSRDNSETIKLIFNRYKSIVKKGKSKNEGKLLKEFQTLLNKIWDNNEIGYSDSYSLFLHLQKLKLCKSIYFIKDQNKITGSIYIETMNGSELNLAEASSGLVQLLPIICGLFNASSTSKHYTLIEQPELHLHPKLQAELAHSIAMTRNSSIVETHSEHLIRKLQVLIAQGKLSKERVAVYYFHKDEKTGTTSIKEMKMEENGFFKEPWPDEFFDDSFNLSMELLTAKRN